ncbi:type VI secretion system Vgr family protein [Methylocella silvestris]|uniref:Type VI secretion system tip protein VgrG n=1 Tax=Methylocella silvestris TaxID=199596 RepID=A0A2J7TH48_METSI|nr:type VI secretion system tip protein TssI/VgrG [Methylocella silvestris]PNG26091.1 type VI secretion system tip protein VgrG [Methylocella silvestris]
MTSELTQDKRVASLETPLGKDKLVCLRFDGAEALSELFEYRVEALSTEANVDFDKAIGNNCSVTFKSYSDPDRVFNGVLVEAQALGAQAGLNLYRLTLKPWLWLLSRTSDCRIFENQTAVDIIKKVFSDRGFSDYRVATTGKFPELEYCVQYRETDLAFVSRLMEQHGIYYFFEHQKDKHTLVLADAKSSHKPVPGHAETPFIGDERQTRREREHISRWTPERRFRSGKFELNDYDYLQPNADLKSDAEGQASYTKSKMEIYDYPGKFKKKNDGETYAKVRLQAEQAMDKRRYADGDSISLLPGGLTALKDHPEGGENKEYLVLRALHSYSSQAYRSGGAQGEDLYSGRYELLSSDVNYRAPLATPRPIVYGPQTAKVVGKDGEEIDVDEHGRILVRFYWDRKNKQSCRVRVAQVWAGKGWGGQAIPRIGQEVVVEFLEGDPDRPLVTGAVYNGDNKYPYEMPANKTQSGLKSDSSKGHGGYNEFMFEDKKGSEKIRMHGERDHEVVIRRAETKEVGEIFSSRSDPSRDTTLKNGSDNLSIQNGNQTVDIKGKQDVSVLETISIEAIQKITLTVGASTITMEPAQITINSPMITVQSSLATKISGGMALNLDAAIIKIN